MEKKTALILAFLMLLGLAGCGGESGGGEAEAESTSAEGQTEEMVSSEIQLEKGRFTEPVEYICRGVSPLGGEGEAVDSLFFFPEGYCVYWGRVRNLWPYGMYDIEGDRIFANFAGDAAPFYFLIREGGIVPLQEGLGSPGMFCPENQGEFSCSPEELLQRTMEGVAKNGGNLDPDFTFNEVREYRFTDPETGDSQSSGIGWDLIFYPNSYCYLKRLPGEEWPAGQYVLEGDTVYIVFNSNRAERLELKLDGDRLQARTEKEEFWEEECVWERNLHFSPDQVQDGYLYWRETLTGAELDNRWILEEGE